MAFGSLDRKPLRRLTVNNRLRQHIRLQDHKLQPHTLIHTPGCELGQRRAVDLPFLDKALDLRRVVAGDRLRNVEYVDLGGHDEQSTTAMMRQQRFGGHSLDLPPEFFSHVTVGHPAGFSTIPPGVRPGQPLTQQPDTEYPSRDSTKTGTSARLGLESPIGTVMAATALATLPQKWLHR